MSKLVVIDGHAILYRAYHALPSLNTPNGRLVNAVYGFCRMLLKIIVDFKPYYLLVAFDTPKPTFRHKKFIGYQIKRPKMDKELAGQIVIVKEVLQAMKIKFLAKEGYEADDIIGTLSRKVFLKSKVKTKKSKLKIIIITGDRDLMQLVNKETNLFIPIKGLSNGQLVDEKYVEKDLEIRPDQVVDYKALMGDNSDNYPGVAGVGPKTAVKLLREFGSLDNIYCSLDKVESASLADKLKKGKKAAYLSQDLARIRCSIPLKMKIKDLRLKDWRNEATVEVFKNLGFRSLVREMRNKRNSSKQERLF
jgi:DNA polymerase-1